MAEVVIWFVDGDMAVVDRKIIEFVTRKRISMLKEFVDPASDKNRRFQRAVRGCSRIYSFVKKWSLNFGGKRYGIKYKNAI